MPDLRFAGMLIVGFALGSLPFSVWIGRGAGGVDVRRVGSGNPGAANVWRNVGRASGLLAGALDAAKGAAVVFLCRGIGLPDTLSVWPGAAAVVGHDYSPLLGFRGGKGGATMVGMLACFLLPELLVVLAVWLAAGALFRSRRFLLSIVCLSGLPLLALASGRLHAPGISALPVRSGSVVIASALLTALLWVRVAPGLRGRSV